MERILELANIAVNKNTVPGDKSALIPGGIRMGTPAMTTRGLQKKDFEAIAGFVDRAVHITADVKKQVQGGTKLKDFKETVGEHGAAFPEIQKLKQDVTEFARTFPVIGFGKCTRWRR